MRRAFFSLGSNLGDRARYLRDAVNIVAGNDEYRVSSVYETEPVGGVVQDNFWNIVLEIHTAATAHELLARAHEAEEHAERTRELRWGPRTLDVDVLLVGEETSEDPELQIPHPRMYQRRFVLAPLRELAPELVDPLVLAGAEGAVRVLGTLSSLR